VFIQRFHKRLFLAGQCSYAPAVQQRKRRRRCGGLGNQLRQSLSAGRRNLRRHRGCGHISVGRNFSLGRRRIPICKFAAVDPATIGRWPKFWQRSSKADPSSGARASTALYRSSGGSDRQHRQQQHRNPDGQRQPDLHARRSHCCSGEYTAMGIPCIAHVGDCAGRKFFPLLPTPTRSWSASALARLVRSGP
jgi:hypothetical protein